MMRIGVLFSGGKDSCLACMKAMEKEDVVCLISIASRNRESFMFHTPNNNLLRLQAEAMGLPIVVEQTTGEKEAELEDLKNAISRARQEHDIEGIVTGAAASVYQASRIQKICADLGLWCFNPLWQKDQVELLNEIVEKKFHAIISGVFAEPLDESFLGIPITPDLVEKLERLQKKHGINPAGEGGEIETTVLDAPFFRKKILVEVVDVKYKNNSGTCTIMKAMLVSK